MNGTINGYLRGYMEKDAGVVSEWIGSAITPELIPFAGPAANVTGVGASALTPTRSEPEQVKASKNVWRNLVPGIGGYNLWKRRGRTAAEAEEAGVEGARGKILSESLGPWTSSLLATALGGAVGAGAGALNPEWGAERGAKFGAKTGAGGAGLALLVATALAALTKRRSKEEQLNYEGDAGETALNWLVPGTGLYSNWKRLGYSRKYDEEASRVGALETAERQARLRELINGKTS